MPHLEGAVVLVTGANGGIGAQFVEQALARGARRVYATARTPRDWDDDRVVPLALDVNDPASVAAAATTARDVTVLVNNAGSLPAGASILDLSDEEFRAGMETNFFGPVALTRAFAPTLAGRPGAALVNVHSVASWYAFGGVYSASKAAMWSATNSLRLELAPRGVHVLGVHMGYVDTAMAAHASGPKMSPTDLVSQVLDALGRDEFEVLADDTTRAVKAGLSGPVEALYPGLVAPS
ncbi:SDR family oxidoreductase [Nocardioides sp.]|uniref:SDR family oxidoreductase n=1 Tax=Nocardioides sp. TaxID=35761 RepID=UPI0035197882